MKNTKHNINMYLFNITLMKDEYDCTKKKTHQITITNFL